jgi:aldehyde:ferredoxin oxidoreductase
LFNSSKYFKLLEEQGLLGYAGTILYINLTTGKTRTEKLSDEVAKKYIGGIGLGMKLTYPTQKQVWNHLPLKTHLSLLWTSFRTMFPTGGNGHAFI